MTIKKLLDKLQNNSKSLSSIDQKYVKTINDEFLRTGDLSKKDINRLKSLKKRLDTRFNLEIPKETPKVPEIQGEISEEGEIKNYVSINKNSPTSGKIKISEEFDGVATPYDEHYTIPIGFYVDKKGEFKIIMRSFTKTNNKLEIICKGVEKEEEIPKENQDEYKRATGKEVPEFFFYNGKCIRPLSTALHGLYGKKGLQYIGDLPDGTPQYMGPTAYCSSLDHFFKTHTYINGHKPPKHLKNQAIDKGLKNYVTEISQADSNNNSEMGDKESKEFVNTEKKYMFNSEELENLERTSGDKESFSKTFETGGKNQPQKEDYYIKNFGISKTENKEVSLTGMNNKDNGTE